MTLVAFVGVKSVYAGVSMLSELPGIEQVCCLGMFLAPGVLDERRGALVAINFYVDRIAPEGGIFS